MKRFIVRLLAFIGGACLLFFIAAVVLTAMAVSRKPGVPDGFVLELELDAPLMEAHPDESLASAFGESKPTVRDVVDALQKASGDKRVKGLIAHVGASPGSMAVVQELRDAVKAFRKSGKPTIAWADSFGEFGGANGAYFLASAFDDVYIQPSGDVGLIGFAAETPFARDAFAKLGVQPQMGQRKEYKNAVNTYTEQGYNAPHREATEKYVGSLFGQLVRGVAEDRGRTDAEVRALVDRSPLPGKDALAEKLVDGLLYRDEVYEKVRALTGGKKPELLYLAKYLKRAGRPNDGGTKMALIYGVGEVRRGESASNPLSGSEVMGADTVARALHRATQDSTVKAIVFRVDSPGGSYLASDSIRREVQRAREKGKPVVVSMGSLAASGGYFVAMEADRIVAQPGTLTGSIGVFGGKMVTAGLWEKLGVNWDTIAYGKMATLASTDLPYTPEQRALVDASLDRIYADFTAKAAAGRKVPLDRLEPLAHGRVWTGEDAKGLGLVDALGGLPRAFDEARALAKLAPGAPLDIQVFPRKKDAAEILTELLGGDAGENSEEAGARLLNPLAPLVEATRALYRTAVQLGLTEQAEPLRAPLP